jgi:hypothetical protein
MADRTRYTANLVSNSNLYVDIATDRVGIGTTNPTSKLSVTGDVNVTGIITASSFSGNASSATYATTAGIATYATSSGISTYATSSGISTYSETAGIATYATNAGVSTYATTSGIATDLTSTSSVNTTGIITATSFTGSGTNLTNLNASNLSSGIVPAARITETSALNIGGDLYVSGNISFGGTTTQLNTSQLTFSDPDLVLGIGTTSTFNPTDNTANHGGIAVASTEGSPLVNLNIAPLEVLPTTYKKFMWFKNNTAGLGTDAWLSNYAVGIGSTQFPTGTRLAVGNIQFTEDDLTVVRNINASGIITASGGFNLGISSAGTLITSGPITTLNFIGVGNTFAINGTSIDISIATKEPILTPAKESFTFTATEGQTIFSVSYEVGYIDVFLNGIRLNSTEFDAGNGTSITLITPASANDVLDVVEYTMGIGNTGPQGSGGPLNNITATTDNDTYYPIFATGTGTTLPYITTTNDYFEFNPSSGTITAKSFIGDGSGLTGTGSTVADDTSTNATFYPVFTQITSGIITASKVSTTKLSFNPSSGTLNTTELNSTSDINLKTNIRPIQNSIDKLSKVNGVVFNWKDNQKSSVGVIAQEVEKVFPELVKTEDFKSVNYNGLVAVLIEGMKEQQKQINILRTEIEDLKRQK